MIGQAKFTDPTLGKAFQKQTKTIEKWGEKQVGDFKILKSFEKQKPK